MDEGTRETLEEFFKKSKCERWDGQGLVGQFKLDLDSQGVLIEEGKGNSCSLSKGGVRVDVLMHEYTPQNLDTEHKGWWGVYQSQVEKMEEGDWVASNTDRLGWGVVFLHGGIEGNFDVGFWLAGDNFRMVVKGDLDSTGGYNITLKDLEESDLPKKFYAVQEFLRLSGLSVS